MRKAVYTIISGLALLFASSVIALEVEELTYSVFVDVPSLDYYVLPADPLFFIQEQELEWDEGSRDFEPLSTRFRVRNKGGSLTVKSVGLPILVRGFDMPGWIDLNVTINGTELSYAPLPILNQATAQEEAEVVLLVNAVKPRGGYIPGVYKGYVYLVFESGLN